MNGAVIVNRIDFEEFARHMENMLQNSKSNLSSFGSFTVLGYGGFAFTIEYWRPWESLSFGLKGKRTNENKIVIVTSDIFNYFKLIPEITVDNY